MDSVCTHSAAPSIAQRLSRLEQQLDEACQRTGRARQEITLVAVSKKQPVAAIRAAFAAGLRDFGENYPQELHAKASELADLQGIRWHFIGKLQRNKAQLVVGHSVLIHSVSSTALIDRIDRLAAAKGLVQRVLIQLNLSGEASKSGAPEAELDRLLEHIAATEHARCGGLMTMPPLSENPEAVAVPLFDRLRELRDQRLVHRGVASDLRELSMGMTADFDVAIARGATIIRVGTAIFGPRPTHRTTE